MINVEQLNQLKANLEKLGWSFDIEQVGFEGNNPYTKAVKLGGRFTCSKEFTNAVREAINEDFDAPVEFHGQFVIMKKPQINLEGAIAQGS